MMTALMQQPFMHNFDIAMLLVSSQNAEERVRLQSQFSIKHQHFQVPVRESQTVQTIITSILYEFFQNNPPPAALKIKEFVGNSLHLTFSLSMLRQIMALLSKQQSVIKMFRQYFLQMSQVLQQEKEGCILQECSVEENDHLFELAERGDMRVTRTIDGIDFSEDYEVLINYRGPVTKTEVTIQTAIHQNNSEDRVLREAMDRSNHLSNFFYSAETIYSPEWWKHQKRVNDSSREITKFQKRGTNLINQKSIGHLVVDQFRYDLNRQVQLGKDIKKQQELQTQKYSKMMKEKLMSAKLKKRRKK